jgi:3-dehydroquinate dehydratase-2
MLGIREPAVYGSSTYNDLVDYINTVCSKNDIQCETYQSNHEGAIIDKIQSAYKVFDGIIINPAAFTHTSLAIADAIKSVGIPTIEVHISDISKRESFRQFSYTSMVCIKTIMGKGFLGYEEAITELKNII